MQSGNILRHTGAVVAVALTLSACGGGDDDASSTTSAPEITVAPTSAVTTTPPTTLTPTTVAPTTVPPTTAAPTTAAPTTVPLTTSVVTAPPTTTPGPDADLAQFCFDSEQALVADRIIEGIEEPTPEQVEAALGFLAFSVGAAAETAPPELAEQPQRAAVLVDELLVAFAEYDFDPDAFPEEAIDELEPTIDEYTTIITELEQFLTDACDSPIDTLDDQAAKLRPIISDLVTWDLVPIANQAGDVRMLVPEAWNQWFGSDQLTREVSFLQAAPDLQSFDESWNVPGVILTVLYTEPGQATVADIVPETAAAGDCTQTSSEIYEDVLYTGELYRYTDCAGVGTEAIVVAASDGDLSTEIIVEIQFPDGVDNAVVDQLLASFAAG